VVKWLDLFFNKISYVLSNTLFVQSFSLYMYRFVVQTRRPAIHTYIHLIMCDKRTHSRCLSPAVDSRLCVSHNSRPSTACQAQWNTVYSAKHGNSAAAHARKVLPFSVKNELGLENYLGRLGYPCTVPNLVKIGGKSRPLSLTKEKNFVIPEVDRRECALIKSVLAINGTLKSAVYRGAYVPNLVKIG